MTVKNILLLILLACITSSCDMGNFESVLVTPHYSIFYSSDFVGRFSLPKEKAVNLGNEHLKAIAIGIQEINTKYVCNIHLYHDGTIKPYTPNGQDVYYNKRQQEFFFSNNFNDIDYRYYDEQSEKNTGRAYFRSKSLKTIKSGTSSTVGYSGYKKNFLPNLNLASFEIGCNFLDARHGEAELWVQKEGLNNYKLINEDPLNIKHPENSYRFDVPLALLQSVKPLIDRINAIPVDPAASNVTVQYGAK